MCDNSGWNGYFLQAEKLVLEYKTLVFNSNPMYKDNNYLRSKKMAIIYYVKNDQYSNQIIEKALNHAGLTGVSFLKNEDLLAEHQHHKPDLILLNVTHSGILGLEILIDIRRRDKKTPIIMISSLQSEIDKVIALDVGANDYMIKPFGVVELSSRILSKLRSFTDSKTYQYGNILLDDKKHICSIDEKEIYLTNKEFSILKLLIKNKNSTVTKDAIFKDVWDTDFMGETRTLDMHIKSLRQKLKTEESTVAIKTIRGIGYSIE